MRLLVIGFAPAGPDDDGRHPLTGGSGERLAKLMNVSWDEYLVMTERVNLFPTWPGPRWPVSEARRCGELLMRVIGGRRVVGLGRTVQAALDLEGTPWCRWVSIQPTSYSAMAEVGLLPHPSGRNRWYNSPSNYRTAQAFMMRARDGTRP